jgi:hypothetical protein
MSYLAKAIKLLKPTAEFSYIEEDYSTIDWQILEGDAPTLAEIDEAIEQVKLNEVAEAQAKADAKAALLERLGITDDEAKLLLG